MRIFSNLLSHIDHHYPIKIHLLFLLSFNPLANSSEPTVADQIRKMRAVHNQQEGIRVVKSSRLPVKIAAYLVSTGPLLCLAFRYRWRFLNKISLNWPLTLTTQPFTSNHSDNPVVYCNQFTIATSAA